jgi:hypothetical protein
MYLNQSVSKVELNCQTSGKPKPKLTWFKGDQLITNQYPNKYKLSKENSTLTIIDLNDDDDGFYYCHASSLERYPVATIYYSLKSLFFFSFF